MNICLIAGGDSSRFHDFMAEIMRRYPDAIKSTSEEAEMFFIDYLRKDVAQLISKYEKPIHMIGYSSIQGNPKIFITKMGGDNGK
ncbi:MAG: hypothetical protein RBT65_15670 [Methanolobus sp.]|nr:hypothetical protein [Methanolobus sp.]